MSANIYVGNLPYNTSEDDLKNMFSSHGDVSSVKIITDRFSGQSRGFGFVEMSVQDEAQQAIDALNGETVSGRKLKVNLAKPRH